MKIKLKKFIKKYGMVYVAILFGYHDTHAVRKWVERGSVPQKNRPKMKKILEMSDKEVKNLVMLETKRRLEL